MRREVLHKIYSLWGLSFRNSMNINVIFALQVRSYVYSTISNKTLRYFGCFDSEVDQGANPVTFVTGTFLLYPNSMFHFPSSSGAARRSEGCNLNATQQKSSKYPIFVKVEEDLHDARRVHADGQEDDLRYALNMVINRVTELVNLLSSFRNFILNYIASHQCLVKRTKHKLSLKYN